MDAPAPAVPAPTRLEALPEVVGAEWKGRVRASRDAETSTIRLECPPALLRQVCERLTETFGCALATLVVEQPPDGGWRLTYVFDPGSASWVFVELALEADRPVAPSLSGAARGPSADWQEREAADLFGLRFEGHPRLGDFVLHPEWAGGRHPMRSDFDPRGAPAAAGGSAAPWRAPTIVSAPGAFAMPIGPVFADFAEAAHFQLETVGEDVIRTIPRFFFKYRGVEKIAEGCTPGRALLLAERFSGTSAFAHALAFCQAVELIERRRPPPRAEALRTVFAELERLRHHAAAIAGICHSTALAVAASQAALIEEDLLRLSAEVGGHRYLFGLAVPGGLARDLTAAGRERLEAAAAPLVRRLGDLHEGLRYTSSFLDRLEQVGVVSPDAARTYGLVGPIARASGLGGDIRKSHAYAAYGRVDFAVPVEAEGDGYARLRILFQEADQSVGVIRQVLDALPTGEVRAPPGARRAGAALAAVEAPSGGAFHWLRLGEHGRVLRYRITPPAFANWHGFHLAAENFAFQDFPIILASFGLSNAECDR